jgi:hypothetical protein
MTIDVFYGADYGYFFFRRAPSKLVPSTEFLTNKGIQECKKKEQATLNSLEGGFWWPAVFCIIPSPSLVRHMGISPCSQR